MGGWRVVGQARRVLMHDLRGSGQDLNRAEQSRARADAHWRPERLPALSSFVSPRRRPTSSHRHITAPDLGKAIAKENTPYCGRKISFTTHPTHCPRPSRRHLMESSLRGRARTTKVDSTGLDSTGRQLRGIRRKTTDISSASWTENSPISDLGHQ
ncbi:hypothetical protein BC567DRAFT_15986 [Phyllosticta citribraziliensis]